MQPAEASMYDDSKEKGCSFGQPLLFNVVGN